MNPGRKFILRGICFCFLLLGCSNQSPSTTLALPETVRAKTLLLSEIQSTEEFTDVIQCPIQIENKTGERQSLKLVSTGCSCYGVTFEGRKLAKGESLKIEPNGSVSLNIDAQPPLTESLRDYRTRFEFQSAMDETVQQNVRCELQVYRDLKIFPRVLVCDTDPGESRKLNKELTIERIDRSDDGTTPEPVLKNLPKGVSVLEITRIEEPIELESGLWKTVWVAPISVHVDGNLSATGKRETCQVEFGESESDVPPVIAQTQIVRRVRASILFPKQIQFGRIPVGEKRNRTIFLTQIEDASFQLTLDQSQLPENVSVSFPEEPDSRFRVEIEIEGTKAGEWAETLTFSTNLRKQPTVEIDLKAIFKAPGSD